MRIETYDFSETGRSLVKGSDKGADWPVVYMIAGDSEAYIGETCSIGNRFSQHLANEERRKLKRICIILDDQFNKSAVLDIEQSLIQLCGADGKFKLQNQNSGQSSKHNYYQREIYANKLPDIWSELIRLGLAKHDLDFIRNSNLFKYSPYTALTPEQTEVSNEVVMGIVESIESGNHGAAIINGSAGTGKTVLAINMMFSLVSASRGATDPSEIIEGFTDEQLAIHELRRIVKERGPLDVALVVPMTSIRKTLQKVFKATGNGLKSSMVIGPFDAAKKHYDVLFVDESHRLARRANISNMGDFDDTCRKLGMDPETSTQLDWIVRSSDYQVLFYDQEQTVRGSDITPEQLASTLPEYDRYDLVTQLRCRGGDDYIHYLERIFECRQARHQEVLDYDLRIFDDADEMVQAIRRLDSEIGLSRNVAGYSWKWRTKGMTSEAVKESGLYDIEIGPYRYVWNMSNVEWILRPESADEIGCIHTTQGYDLNYVGVIFGPEIDYDEETNRITVDPSKYYDINAKKGTDPETVRRYVINAYRVLMTRGIKGCYVYACNDCLKSYLKQYI
ncbi:MAG: DUF2075 domain-containing protein [Thermoplasmata archaeon]|nr:DUF2075 domain-containing protein [Thermoplasmata archaeon]